MESDPSSASILWQLILIAILTLVNAFFAAAEMAIVSLNKNKIKVLSEEGNKEAKLLEKLLQEPTKFLSTIQVGITFAGFLSSAFAATGIADDFGRFLQDLGIPYSNEIALILVTIVLAYFTLVFGELFPKRVGLKKAEPIALFSVRPIVFVSKITGAFVKLLSVSTNALIKLFGMSTDDLEEKFSKEEIKSMVEVGQENGVINETEKEMINSIFEFDDKLAKEVMTPRTEVYLINLDKPLDEYLDELLEEQYSRIPVFQGDIDNVVGILYMKDFLLEARRVGFENVKIEQIMHAPYFVPERKNIDELFKHLQSFKQHMAILIDEYGGFSGIVTMEDLIEEVMGNIDDEFDEDEPDIRKIDNYTYIVKGLIAISELNEQLDLDLDEDSENFDTLGGFLITLTGNIPKDGEEEIIEHKGIVYKVEKVKEKRIEKVKICIKQKGTTN